MNQGNQQQKFINGWNEICKNEEEISSKRRKMKEEKQKMMDEIMKEMSEKDEENGKLKKEIRGLKMKMAKMEADLKAHNVSVHRRKMPSELINELFGSLPLQNAFVLLTKMPNGLLARNIQKMIKSIKMAMKGNKLNAMDCGIKLTIFEEGLLVKHSGPFGFNSVRAVLPIPSFNLCANAKKPSIAFYFEMQILNKSASCAILIGFCTDQFSLLEDNNNWPGKWNNTIMIGSKKGICIDLTTVIKFENDEEGSFKEGDFVGIGLLVHHSPTNSSMECFATWNGHLLGKADLPEKFLKLHLFPAVHFAFQGDSIRTNFGKEKWQFQEFNKLLQ